MEMDNEYPKIDSVYKRDNETHKFIIGEFSIPEFEYLKGNLWWFTEKVNGTNIRVAWDSEFETLQFCGKTNQSLMPERLYRKLNEMFTVDKFEALYPETSMCLYGEGYGEKIESGSKYIPQGGVSFVLFDVLIDGWWLRRRDIEDIAYKLGICIVPIAGRGTLTDAVALIQSRTLKSQWGDFLAEGIVLKPDVELRTRAGDRIITKVKHKDFKKGE